MITGFFAGLFALVLNIMFFVAYFGFHLKQVPPAAVVSATLIPSPSVLAPETVKQDSQVPLRGDLPVTVVYPSRSEPDALIDDGRELDAPAAQPQDLATTTIEPSTADSSSPDETQTEQSADALPEGIPAMLHARGSKPGVEIGNFKPVTMQGGADECLAIGQSLVGSAKGGQLDVMVSSRQITVAKICANNGTIFLTCRGGQITISPRRARPDSRCEKNDA